LSGVFVLRAPLHRRSDVTVEDGVIAVGPNLRGDDELNATAGCYVMPGGGIDPHTHAEMPFAGTYSTDDFESALAAGWRNHMVMEHTVRSGAA
jgi:dihydropyrimidinase